MTFLPVVGRELRVAARRRNTYWTRFFAAFIAIVVCTWIWLAVGDDPRSELPKILFYTLSGLAFAYSLFAGAAVTSDCLSEEKRDGTLGLLFLTDLKGYDVVLGKLAATSLNSLYRLVAVFPVMAIPLLFGGLTYSEFWRMVLVLSNTLFFSLAAGIVISALSYHERKAMMATVLLVLLITAGPALVGYIVAVKQNPFQFNPALALASPGCAYALAFDQTFRAVPHHFWTSITITHACGWGFLILACVIARHTWQDRPSGTERALWIERWRKWQFGGVASRLAFRTHLLDINPFFWLAGRNRLKPAYVLAVLGAVGAGWLWLFFKYRRDMLDPAAYIPTAFILHLLIRLWVASEACRTLAADRRSGSLELLLSTPLSVDDILRGQMLALKRQFGGPVAIILLADFAMFLAGTQDRFLDHRSDWLLLWLAGISIFIADLYTIGWVGMWLGLTARKANVAARGTVARVLILPTIIFVAFVTSTFFIQINRMNDPGDMMLGAWFVIGMLNNLFFFTWARSNLRDQFRTVATQRFDVKASRGWLPTKESKSLAAGEPANA